MGTRIQQVGAARGALICASFGTVWMMLAVVFSGHPRPVVFAIAAIPGILLLTRTMQRLRALGKRPKEVEDVERGSSVMTRYWWVVATEWVLSGVAVILLTRLKRDDLTPQVLGVIIGLHFLPLARIFKVALYNSTGALMVGVSLLSLLVSRGYGRNIIACGGLSLVLWLTSLIMLLRTSSPLQAGAAAA